MRNSLLLPLTLVLTLACSTHPVEGPEKRVSGLCSKTQPMFLEKDVDILFVIDNSGSMLDEQRLLTKNFPKLIEALRSSKLGGQIPNIRIGVVSSDLGAGSYSMPTCQPGGDRGQLQNKPRKAGCPTLSDPWIRYHEGQTNILRSETTDPISQVQEAFSCIAELGTDGCGFEQSIEAARQALDPKLNINLGFLRPDALLAVIFITDEDDCSAQNPQIYNDDPISVLGPLSSYRCFEHGITCTCDGGNPCKRDTEGFRKNCKSSGSFLQSIDTYIKFFSQIKKTPNGQPDPSRVIMAAIAGDVEPVKVVLQDGIPRLNESCSSQNAYSIMGLPQGAYPGIRIRELVHAFAPVVGASDGPGQGNGQFVDAQGLTRLENMTSICSGDYSVALEGIGRAIISRLLVPDLDPPPLSDKGHVVCRAGDVLGPDAEGQPVFCQNTSLSRAAVEANLVDISTTRSLNACPDALWDPAIASNQCGFSCPCWRLVPASPLPSFAQGKGTLARYSLEVMQRTPAAKGTFLHYTYACTPFAAGSSRFAALPQSN